jgi:diadenosine tetraphosphate (Ap4A) HIT family hydrolase
MMTSCDFCVEAVSGKINPTYVGEIGQTSRILSSWRSFYLVPTISPIVKNHILLIPKRHVTAQTHLSLEESEEFAFIEREITAKLIQEETSVVFFEHGIGRGAAGGCGVSHCHIHVMPLDQSIAESFIQRFQRLEVGATSKGLTSISATQSYTYVHLESGTSAISMVREGIFPSQFLRNLLEDTLGMPHSNWRDITQTALFSETLVSAEWL